MINITDIKNKIQDKNIVGSGGEAVIYKMDKNTVAKIFKTSSHPDFLTKEEQDAADLRIQEHQSKLPNFPKGTPPNVIAPLHMVTQQKKIIGYTMHFIQDADLLKEYSKKQFRQLIPNNDISIIFKKLRETIDKLHNNNITIGDFNDLNVLVDKNIPYVIDIDSSQYGSWYCKVFTQRFVDPLNCNSNMELIKPHTKDTDWYAFNLLLFQSLLLTSPYGGVFSPKNKKNLIPHGKRPLKRISIFHKEVNYPKPATPYKVLPDSLLHHFQEVLEKDVRVPFPNDLLDLEWKTCKQCGLEHSRIQCPDCVGVAPAAIKETIEVRGLVTATKIFTTPGMIVFAQVINNKLQHIYTKENTPYQMIYIKSSTTEREISRLTIGPGMRFRIFFNRFLTGDKNGTVMDWNFSKPTSIVTDSFVNLAMFDTNSIYIYYVQHGQLKRTDPSNINKELVIGDVLENQTLFWVGETFGFGFYRAGNYTNAFVFDAERKGINDTVKLPFIIKGQLLDSSCVFTKNVCWFFVTLNIKGKETHYCTVIDRLGNILFHDEWLFNIRGNAAIGTFLFTPTDDGIKRFDFTNPQEKLYPDTEPFTNAGCYLFLDKEGLYSVNKNSITHLKMK